MKNKKCQNKSGKNIYSNNSKNKNENNDRSNGNIKLRSSYASSRLCALILILKVRSLSLSLRSHMLVLLVVFKVVPITLSSRFHVPILLDILKVLAAASLALAALSIATKQQQKNNIHQ